MNFNPNKLHERLTSEISPAYRFADGDIKEWQKGARKRLGELLGLHRIKAADDDMLTVTREEGTDSYDEYTITFQSEEGYFVPVTLFIPKGIEGKIPVVV